MRWLNRGSLARAYFPWNCIYSSDAEGPFNTASAIHRLKEDIDKLTEEQAKALKLAIYVGMTPDEAQEYDNRREDSPLRTRP